MYRLSGNCLMHTQIFLVKARADGARFYTDRNGTADLH